MTACVGVWRDGDRGGEKVGDYQAHHFPEHLQQRVQVELLGAADGDADLLLRNSLHLLHATHVDLVVHVQTLHVLSVSLRTHGSRMLRQELRGQCRVNP